MIKSPKLKLNRWKNFFQTEDLNWCFCATWIRSLFGISSDVDQIQFVLTTKPGPDKFKIKFEDHYVWVNNQVNMLFEDVFEYKIKPLLGRRRNWYLEVYYWE